MKIHDDANRRFYEDIERLRRGFAADARVRGEMAKPTGKREAKRTRSHFGQEADNGIRGDMLTL